MTISMVMESLEVITAADGKTVDANSDGTADAQQLQMSLGFG